jgi:hypothetical protein
MSFKNLPWSGWKSKKPNRHQKTVMRRKCGQKCFLDTGINYPICKKNTCKVSNKGIYAAFVRSREWKNRRISSMAKRMLRRRGFYAVGHRKTMKRVRY